MRLFAAELKGKGIDYAFKRMSSFFFRPLDKLTQSSKFLLEVRYGLFVKVREALSFSPASSRFLKLPQSELSKRVREFWYSNTPGDFNLDGNNISRKDIFIYGGPNSKFSCPVCQKLEWLSRVRQKNLFVPHYLYEHSEEHAQEHSKECEDLCKKQGDELWMNVHQNFDFSVGCDNNLPALKCLCVTPGDEGGVAGGFCGRFNMQACDQWMLVFRRRLAFTCQIDVVRYPTGINWNNYDFIFVQNAGANQKFPRPPIPVIMYVHDFWPLENKGFQWMVDWLKPDILLTPCPIQCKENFKIPVQTKIVLYPLFESLFFARPNLNKKKKDLLVIGAISSPIYGQRVSLDKQICSLTNRYKIEFSHRTGTLSAAWPGPTNYFDPVTKLPVNYLNKWSEYLGTAKYLIFGKMKYPGLTIKHYEVLGSGAIPIFPEVPDLKLLGVKPFEHYIPLSEVEGNNQKLAYYLDRYEDYKYIAQNAVKWYKENSDRMLFNDFEHLIREITEYKYPKRLI